ncbi:hypothetical protein [Kitasatospora sp. NPDC018619]|uniref:hypothetical protein n=1 Tax=unclassified Kitasatospora TaxID=2633591 RepID=UPI0037AD15D9
MAEQRLIRVLADYECYPLWLTGEDAGDLSPAEPALALSAGLIGRLDAWSDAYDETLCRDDPMSSGFASQEAEDQFYETGRTLAEDLAAELGGSWKVTYYDRRIGRDLEIPQAGCA